MKSLKFKLSGKFACFRKAEFNSYAYFTYGNIHKPALLGLLGAILGYGGYSQQRDEDEYPEYYEKLRKLKIGIEPLHKYGNEAFSKKSQVFNNSTGCASKERGGNLVVKEEWLENPCWNIYILDDESSEYNKLKEFILEGKAVYIPYLGKNDHMAEISDASVVEVYPSDSEYIDSIVVGNNVKYSNDNDKWEKVRLVKEFAPVAMDSLYNFAIYKQTVCTNCKYDRNTVDNVYSDGEKQIFFF